MDATGSNQKVLLTTGVHVHAQAQQFSAVAFNRRNRNAGKVCQGQASLDLPDFVQRITQTGAENDKRVVAFNAGTRCNQLSALAHLVRCQRITLEAVVQRFTTRSIHNGHR